MQVFSTKQFHSVFGSGRIRPYYFIIISDSNTLAEDDRYFLRWCILPGMTTCGECIHLKALRTNMSAEVFWEILRKEDLFMWKLLKRLKEAVSSAVHSVAVDEDGVGVVEIILILVVLISLVVIFKKQVTSIVKDILSKAASDAKGI